MKAQRKKKGRAMTTMTRNVRLTSEAHRLLSTLAAVMDTNISDTIVTAIREKYPHVAEAADKTFPIPATSEKEDSE